jgi:hypothetical protein
MSPNALPAAHNPASNTGPVELPRRAMLKLPDAAAVQIECRSGSLWITLDHDPRDFVVEAGESFSTQAHTPALVYALQAAVLLVQAQRPAAPSPVLAPAVAAQAPRPVNARPAPWPGLQQPVAVR